MPGIIKERRCLPSTRVNPATIALAFSMALAQATPGACAQFYKVLYSFTGGADGGIPQGGLVRDSSGSLYGTTLEGGTTTSSCPSGCGTVFEVDRDGNETVLHSFSGGVDGIGPRAGLVRDADGNLYGTTQQGGTHNQGTVFEVDAAGNETILYSFTGQGGSQPFSSLVRDPRGNLYGTTPTGGAYDYGNVFKVTPAGTETVLYSFTGESDGGAPYDGLISDSAGNLYGTASDEVSESCVPFGLVQCGTVFELNKAGTETVLYSFADTDNGSQPFGSLVRDAAGNLYGTTSVGGEYDRGTAFEVSPGSIVTLLHTFGAGTDGIGPMAGLVRDTAGNLYGTTYYGGLYGWGTVFKLDSTGAETILYNFTGKKDGAEPVAGLVMDTAGNLYGTAQYGGAYDYGVVFALRP
ncbi:MAG TPA: choice-of-anchor tandem repeat GloVer-containing protein [Terriglobia bacterium]|nr:choice-of-anchor tandem repeat GloVer-containing protein [Terriglobia bacterium]